MNSVSFHQGMQIGAKGTEKSSQFIAFRLSNTLTHLLLHSGKPQPKSILASACATYLQSQEEKSCCEIAHKKTFWLCSNANSL